VLIEKPFELQRIPLPMNLIAQNGAAALLAIDKDGARVRSTMGAGVPPTSS